MVVLPLRDPEVVREMRFSNGEAAAAIHGADLPLQAPFLRSRRPKAAGKSRI
jgi:hypothetical protein